MHHHAILYGAAPLPESRRWQLMGQLRAIHPQISALQAGAVYFLDIDDNLPGDQQLRVRSLLGLAEADADRIAGGTRADAGTADSDTLVYVIPRPGTVSPWSSKASDIFHVCGLHRVRRIERGLCYRITSQHPLSEDAVAALAAPLHDRMTETVCCSQPRPEGIFRRTDPQPLREVDLSGDARARLCAVNRDWGLALSEDEIAYLLKYYLHEQRAPTDAELMMFAQINSEHCRHKIFNARWMVDGKLQAYTLFDMIRHTHRCSPQGVLSAYEDNAAVIEASIVRRLDVDPESRRYRCTREPQPFLIKVETHNHPTAISPFSGAATGAGGEIRDEAATGRGGRPKMGLTGFSVSNLHIPGFIQPWEDDESRPQHIASPLQIMIDGPIGAASFNNEFGRPNLCGFFRTFEHESGGRHWGYHKPLMIAGGLGSLRPAHVAKQKFDDGTPLVVFGGPAMRIGLGGGSASSVGGGSSSRDLDFASVQRGNAEIQRRCQEVIAQCAAFGEHNPILAIHDIGAGGLANALPELVDGAGLGGCFELRDVPCADYGMSPMEIWCNEAQERYAAAIAPGLLSRFLELCARERCPAAVVGRATAHREIVVKDRLLGAPPVRMPMPVLFGGPPGTSCSVAAGSRPPGDPLPGDITLEDAVARVLRMPAVSSKSFLVTIGDRSVTGLVARDQMIGPWQVPVSDVAVTTSDYHGFSGEAMAMGERTPVAIAGAPASGRIAVSEAILNLAAADVASLGDIKLSANWMAAAGEDDQSAALFETVTAVARGLCPALGIAIPVGKDSLSMEMAWQSNGRSRRVRSPLSLIVSAFAPVGDVRKTLTPHLDPNTPGARFCLVDVSGGGNRLGGSCLAQAYGCIGGAPADLDDPQMLIALFGLLRALRDRGVILAYHDRSDGGLFTCLAEMAFAGHCGIKCSLDALPGETLPLLFSEEPGVVLQLDAGGVEILPEIAAKYGLSAACFDLGCCTPEPVFNVRHRGSSWSWETMQLKRWWSETSFRIQSLRDNPECAREEMDSACDPGNPGLSASPAFDLSDAAPATGGARPRVAILREQGVNGQMEMAAAFERAGFDCFDVHTSDLSAGGRLDSFHGLAVCGGFSYGDVLGAGVGWAKSILFHEHVRTEFERFFNRGETFTLGVCNGCQMLSQLKQIIPGTEHWPRFERNRADQFEARLVRVEVAPSPSILLAGMQRSKLPIVVAHGEGRVVFNRAPPDPVRTHVCLRYIDNHGRVTEHYPENPNGSPGGITGLCNTDGRVTIMMPHPERLFRSVQYSWRPPGWGDDSPWMQLFRNARAWLAST